MATQKENLNSNNHHNHSHSFQNTQGGAADPRRNAKARPLPKASHHDHSYEQSGTEQQNNTINDCAGNDLSL